MAAPNAILLQGHGPRLAWVRDVLERLSAAAPERPQIVPVTGAPTRELLLSLLARPIDALVLVDHQAPLADQLAAQAVRGEAQRAVLALELGRRATRTLTLAGDADRWCAALAELLGAPLPDALSGPLPATVDKKAAKADPTVHDTLAKYLAPLFAAAGDPAPLMLAWPRDCFLDGDAPGKPLPATVEVAGRARILAYGPYLPLPAGRWHAKAYLGFSPDIGKMPFILEADSGGPVSRGFFEVERGGIFTLDLDFEVSDAMHPVEMRLISQESALEGQLALIEIALAPI